MKNKRLLIVAAAAIVLTVLAFLPSGESYEDFMKQASRTAGHIVRKEERYSPVIRRSEYFVTYSYRDDKGVTHTTRTLLEYEDLWRRLREGQVENVYYDKNNPSRSYLGVVLDKKLGR